MLELWIFKLWDLMISTCSVGLPFQTLFWPAASSHVKIERWEFEASWPWAKCRSF